MTTPTIPAAGIVPSTTSTQAHTGHSPAVLESPSRSAAGTDVNGMKTHPPSPSPGRSQRRGWRLGPKHARVLLPVIMATVMSLVISLVETIARLGFTPSLVGARLASFALGVAVTVPMAALIAPGAQRLVAHLTGAPARP